MYEWNLLEEVIIIDIHTFLHLQQLEKFLLGVILIVGQGIIRNHILVESVKFESTLMIGLQVVLLVLIDQIQLLFFGRNDLLQIQDL